MVNFNPAYGELHEDGAKALTYTFEELAGRPNLLSKPATDANTRFKAARLKRIGKRTAGGRKRIRMDVNTLDSAREEDMELMAKFCVSGWGDRPPEDTDGNPVPFSAQNCLDFFKAIPTWMFDDYRTWAQEPLNFVGDEISGDDDTEEDAVEDVGEPIPGTSDGNSSTSETVSA